MLGAGAGWNNGCNQEGIAVIQERGNSGKCDLDQNSSREDK